MTGSMLGIILPYSDHFLENWPVGRTYYKLMLVNQPVYVYKILLRYCTARHGYSINIGSWSLKPKSWSYSPLEIKGGLYLYRYCSYSAPCVLLPLHCILHRHPPSECNCRNSVNAGTVPVPVTVTSQPQDRSKLQLPCTVQLYYNTVAAVPAPVRVPVAAHWQFNSYCTTEVKLAWKRKAADVKI